MQTTPSIRCRQRALLGCATLAGKEIAMLVIGIVLAWE
jgi:hypothetical protein